MPGGFVKFAAPILGVVLTAAAQPADAARCRATSRAPAGTALIRPVATPSSPLLVRLAARRPVCGQLVVLPRSGVRVLAVPGAALRVIRSGRRAVTVRPGARVTHIVAIARSNRIIVRWAGRRVVVSARVVPERRVVLRRGVSSLRRTAATTTGPGGGAPGTTGSSPAGGGASSGSGGATTSPGAGSAPGQSSSSTVAMPARMFAATSVWYQRADIRPLSPDGQAAAADLRDQAARTGTWINIDEWSVPIYVVGPDTPLVTVHDPDDGEMNGTNPWNWGRVPLPAAARAAGPHPGDNHLVVWQPSSDTMWEFWNFARVNGVPQSPHGARISAVSTRDGSIPSPWGASASGIAIAAGLITAADVSRGSIDHALAIGIPEIRPGLAQAPATRTDGYVDRATAPVMGMHFRLDPRLDIDALDLPPLVSMIAHAAQRHGMVVRDTAGSVSFYAQDPISIGSDPFTPLLAGMERGEAMRRFPWGHLELVAP
ncbi:MAG: hypothetical protein KDC36_03135 [Thermoleophilia bacterium]|nr:hypothetical protein [Thermoleophilia bacterium]